MQQLGQIGAVGHRARERQPGEAVTQIHPERRLDATVHRAGLARSIADLTATVIRDPQRAEVPGSATSNWSSSSTRADP